MSVGLFLSGDVMTGRGIDQVMPHPGDPTLHEPLVKSAVEYVRLAEQRNGPIPRSVEPEYVWGDALEVLDDAGVDTRIINLETAVTDNDEPWPGKGIHYRMHPANVDCITAAGIDGCVLANNHVLDWSYPGLADTIETLRGAALRPAGAGADLEEAERPAVIDTRGGDRVLLFALGHRSSGISSSWAAGPERPGVAFSDSMSNTEVERVARDVAAATQAGDLVVASIHWGPNWGYDIPRSHRRFAHDLIDRAGVHVVHGHSSHHAIGIEVYRGRPILYGCGDLINDYEGIQGHERYHPDLGVIYLLTMDPFDGLQGLELVPMRMRRFRLGHAPREEASWLGAVLNREGERLGTRADEIGGRLRIRW